MMQCRGRKCICRGAAKRRAICVLSRLAAEKRNSYDALLCMHARGAVQCMFKAQRPEACMGRSMSSLGYAGNLFKAIRLEPIVAEDFKCA